MRRGMGLMLVAVVALSVARPAEPALPTGGPFRVIVHPANPVSVVSRSFVTEVFLKKSTTWPDGVGIRPVNLGPESPVRRLFDEHAVGRPLAAVRSYWQQVIFSGRGLPPPELESEAAVVEFVLRNRGAIGYVSASVDVGAAKTLRIE